MTKVHKKYNAVKKKTLHYSIVQCRPFAQRVINYS